MHQYVLQTPRLILRPLTPEDAEAAFVWLSDPKVNRYMPYNLYTSVEEARRWLESVAQGEGTTFEFGFERKADGLLIGAGGIGPNEAGDCWEVGYNLRSDCWNQGFATEAARKMIAFAHETFGVCAFGGNHAVANPASGRVLEHCGMHFDHFCEYSRFDGSETFPAKQYFMLLE